MLQRAFLVFLLSASSVLADDASALQWLDNMSQAMKSLNYQGTVVFVKNGRLDTMKYFHAVNQGVEQERLLSLNSPMRDVVRKAGKVRCKFQESGKTILDHRPVGQSFVVDLPDSFLALKDVYHFSIVGEESVALRPVRVIAIEPKDRYRFGRKIWIDKQHFLPLKVEIYDLSGETLEQVVFTDLQVVNKLTFAQSDSQQDDLKTRNINRLEPSSIEDVGIVLGNIPIGFKLIYVTRMNTEHSDRSVDHLFLGDGFSSISVYREAKGKGAKTGSQTMGIFNLFTQVIDDHQVTAMGEVPEKAVQFIAQGVSFR